MYPFDLDENMITQSGAKNCISSSTDPDGKIIAMDEQDRKIQYREEN